MLVENVKKLTIELENGKVLEFPKSAVVVRKVNTVGLGRQEVVRYYEIVANIKTAESDTEEERVVQ